MSLESAQSTAGGSPDDGWTTAATARHTAVAAAVLVGVFTAALALWELGSCLRCCCSASRLRPRCAPASSGSPATHPEAARRTDPLSRVPRARRALPVVRRADDVGSGPDRAPRRRVGPAVHRRTAQGAILNELTQRLHHLPSADQLVQPALSVGARRSRCWSGSCSRSRSAPTGSSNVTGQSTWSRACCPDRSARSCATPGR